MTSMLVRGGHVLDVVAGELHEHDVLAADGRIVEVGTDLRAPDGTEVIDAAGLVVMPGLIDAHVHVTAATADLSGLSTWPVSYVTAHAATILRDMLHRGFTTVRDASGADFGLARAQREGLLTGPRIAFCGKALSQTGGHGDGRGPARRRRRTPTTAPASAASPTGSTPSAGPPVTSCGREPTTSR